MASPLSAAQPAQKRCPHKCRGHGTALLKASRHEMLKRPHICRPQQLAASPGMHVCLLAVALDVPRALPGDVSMLALAVPRNNWLSAQIVGRPDHPAGCRLTIRSSRARFAASCKCYKFSPAQGRKAARLNSGVRSRVAFMSSASQVQFTALLVGVGFASRGFAR